MLAIIAGTNSTSVAQAVMEASDVRDIYAYNTTMDFVKEVSKQNLEFSRVVIFATEIMNEQELRNIQSLFIKNRYQTQIVIVANSLNQEQLQVLTLYYNVFQSPLYTDYLLQPNKAIDIELAVGLFSWGIDYIRQNFSSQKDVTVEVQQVVRDTGNKKPVEKAKNKLKTMTSASGFIKSFTFGGRIFGKRKLNKQQRSEIVYIQTQAKAVIQG